MSDVKNQKRLAATILGVGKSRIKINPDKIEDVEGAITRSDIKKLIRKGTINVAQKQGVSRGRARALKEKKRQGKRKGQGSRKGTKKARSPSKKKWMSTIRAQRAMLKKLKEEGQIDNVTYRKMYLQTKGGMFKDKQYMLMHMRAEKLLKTPEKEKAEQ